MCASQKKEKAIKPGMHFLLALIPCLLWGSAATFIKLGYRCWNIESSNVWSMVLFSGFRFALTGVLLILYKSLKEHRFDVPKGKIGWRNAFIICLFTTCLEYIFNCIGVGNASGVVASMLNGAGSLFSILFACSLFKQERMTLQKGIGCLLSFAGILIMNLNGGHLTFSLMGEGFILIGAISSGLGTCITKNCSVHDDPVTLTGWQFLMGSIIMIVLAYAFGGRLVPFSAAGSGYILYLGVISAVAYGLWNWLIKMTSVSSVSIFGFLIPIFGVIISAGILGEWEQVLQINRLAALVLICIGIIVVNRKKCIGKQVKVQGNFK